MISGIAVIGQKNELGNKNGLLWQVPGDLPRFKKLTMGHPIIMGRKTYESIGRELAGRTNIVVSRKGEIDSIEKAIELAKKSPGSEEIFVIGGGEIYKLAMPYIDKLYLTVVENSAEADTFFPDYSEFEKVLSDEPREENGIKYRYLTLERV
ncbi:MAG: dihydrofolate reductase [Microgenomates group bacterium]